MAPDKGTITDLEDMTLDTKLSFLKLHKTWKCMSKTEVLSEHAKTWQENGLKNLNYKELKRENIGVSHREHVWKITVDVTLNNHWTDNGCGEDDARYGVLTTAPTR